MKSIYSPYSNKTNSYVDIIKRILQKQGIQTYDIRDVIKRNQIKEIEVANFNWFESKVNQSSLFQSIRFFIVNTLLIYYLKINSVKIIFTLHNKSPHDCKHPRVVRKFMEFFCAHADVIVGLCSDTRKIVEGYIPVQDVDKKLRIIPHPSYIVECDKFYSPLLRPQNELHILFVGAVKKYKNIEIIFEVAEKVKELPIKFIIKGKCESLEYERELQAASKKIENVEVELGFLEDEELYKSISESDILILPYDLNSSLNSGTLYLAFSLGRNVICPEIGTVKEFDSGLIYSYKYISKEDHIEKLKKSVVEAYSEYSENWEKFKLRSEMLYNTVKEHNSEERIGDLYKKLYYKITE